MKWSLNLGKIAGIRLLLHWTFWLLILWIIFSQTRRGGSANDIIFSLILILSVFTCVVLHELGHALTAKRFGIITRRIVLLPIGGMADMEKLPENPKQELLITIAGPTVNILIAALIVLLTPAQNIFIENVNLANLSRYQLFWSSLLSVNIILAVFNLIPAFPMDGGRIFRALLAMKMERAKATKIAANFGQFIAIVFIFAGLFINPFLSLVGIFVFFAAYSENFLIQQQEFLRRYLVRDAMMTNFTRLMPTQTIEEVSDKIIAGPEHDFIVTEDEKVLGIVTYPILIQALKENNANTPVSNIMIRNFDSINLNETLDKIFIKMQKDKNSFIPVLDNQNLKGVINMNHINEFLSIRTAHS
jgi:Zn-dependent protease/CBS domain-containing protein